MAPETPIYPTMRYRRDKSAPGFISAVVNSPEEDAELGSNWADSPAAFGIETAPGARPDPEIAARRGRRNPQNPE